MLQRPPAPLLRLTVYEQLTGLGDVDGVEVDAERLPLERLMVVQEEAWTGSAYAAEALIDQQLRQRLGAAALGEPADEGRVIARCSRSECSR